MTSKNKGLLPVVSFIIGSILSLSIVYFFQLNLYQEKEESITSTPRIDDGANEPIEVPLPYNSNNTEEQGDLKKMIAKQADIIKRLNTDISDLSDQLASLQLKNENIASDENPPLVKMRMDDFENLTKETFIEKFKGIVLSISGNRLEALKRGFERSLDQDEKSLAYQNNISGYLLENNPYSEHYIDDLRCQGDICRLEISTSNDESWEQIYADMTRQDWYTSVTFEEESEFQGRHIYYLPNIDN
ncbi:MAG: hypothetical protein COA86_11025 [Kangiella sp.]|nr:MAG: hypothetical protein COA86_11025 [Kangiella sp.]